MTEVSRTWNRDDFLCSIYAAIIRGLAAYDGQIIYIDRLLTVSSKKLGSSWLLLELLAAKIKYCFWNDLLGYLLSLS